MIHASTIPLRAPNGPPAASEGARLSSLAGPRRTTNGNLMTDQHRRGDWLGRALSGRVGEDGPRLPPAVARIGFVVLLAFTIAGFVRSLS